MTTTDNQEEVFDVVDDEDRVIRQATRGELHKSPNRTHRSIAILIFRGKELFLQRRGPTKDTYANYWTCSVTGHVDAGESYEDAACRELFEEVGIPSNTPLVKIDEHVFQYPYEKERMRFYRCETNAAVTINTTEITEGRFFTLDKNFFDTILPTLQITPPLKFILEKL